MKKNLISTSNLQPHLVPANAVSLEDQRPLGILQNFLSQVWQFQHESTCHQISDIKIKLEYHEFTTNAQKTRASDKVEPFGPYSPGL